jgi:hypothetical protein
MEHGSRRGHAICATVVDESGDRSHSYHFKLNPIMCRGAVTSMMRNIHVHRPSICVATRLPDDVHYIVDHRFTIYIYIYIYICIFIYIHMYIYMYI